MRARSMEDLRLMSCTSPWVQLGLHSAAKPSFSYAGFLSPNGFQGAAANRTP